MVKTVVAMDQHSSTADQINDWSFDTWKKIIKQAGDNEVPKLTGGDAEAAQAIHGGQYTVKEVEESESPNWGKVWYEEAEDGSMKLYKHNYATK